MKFGKGPAEEQRKMGCGEDQGILRDPMSGAEMGEYTAQSQTGRKHSKFKRENPIKIQWELGEEMCEPREC